MRLFSKFHIICAFALFSILLSALFLGSQHFYYHEGSLTNQRNPEFRAAVSFPGRRLVVFGDSWSDNNAKVIQGAVWTDWLCSLYSCHHENLAQTAKSSEGYYISSIVDNSELSHNLSAADQSRLADFKTQTEQWVAAEQEVIKQMDDETIQDRRNRTIMVVSFGVWDLWNVIDKDYGAATKSIDHSIEIIMERLDVLAQAWGSDDLKLIITMAPDVTFLPGFRSVGDEHIAQHKDAVKLVDYWNSHLRGAAELWNKGTIYLFDTNAFLTDLIRDQQLFAAGIEETNGMGKNENPGWENVDDACVGSSQQWVVISEKKQCQDPEKYLFWNDMHLGPSAHRLMGTEVFHGIEEMWLG